MVLRSKELVLGELRRNWLCARSAKESKINNQFISPHNTRYSNQQYARFTCILFPSYYFISFFILFSLCPVFFIFTLSLNLFQVTRFITASFVPRLRQSRLSSRIISNSIFPDLKVYSVLWLHTKTKTRKRFHRRVSNCTKRYILYYYFYYYYYFVQSSLRKWSFYVIDFNLDIILRVVFISVSFPRFYIILSV